MPRGGGRGVVPAGRARSPPARTADVRREHDAGTEPIPTLLEYADYSASKLDHYVDDAAALRSAVATRQTYLRRLDAEPVRVDWPPPSATALPWLCRAYRSVVARFADESVVAALREVRGLAERDDYERLRESALARSELTEAERDGWQAVLSSKNCQLPARPERLSTTRWSPVRRCKYSFAGSRG